MKIVIFNIVSIIAALLLSPNANAGTEDLKTFHALLSIGVQNVQFMSQAHIALDHVECVYANHSKQYQCDLFDITANAGEGADLTIKGKKAKALFSLLAKARVPSNRTAGILALYSPAIRCSQELIGAKEKSAAERTFCTVSRSLE